MSSPTPLDRRLPEIVAGERRQTFVLAEDAELDRVREVVLHRDPALSRLAAVLADGSRVTLALLEPETAARVARDRRATVVRFDGDRPVSFVDAPLRLDGARTGLLSGGPARAVSGDAVRARVAELADGTAYAHVPAERAPDAGRPARGDGGAPLWRRLVKWAAAAGVALVVVAGGAEAGRHAIDRLGGIGAAPAAAAASAWGIARAGGALAAGALGDAYALATGRAAEDRAAAAALLDLARERGVLAALGAEDARAEWIAGRVDPGLLAAATKALADAPPGGIRRMAADEGARAALAALGGALDRAMERPRLERMLRLADGLGLDMGGATADSLAGKVDAAALKETLRGLERAARPDYGRAAPDAAAPRAKPQAAGAAANARAAGAADTVENPFAPAAAPGGDAGLATGRLGAFKAAARRLASDDRAAADLRGRVEALVADARHDGGAARRPGP